LVDFKRAYRRKKEVANARPDGDLSLPSTLYGPDRAGTVVVGGFGVGIRVSDGHLVVSTRDEGELRFSRISRLRRLVVIGTSGSVSLLALWWCREVDVCVLVVEPSGRVLTIASPDGRSDARLRRTQATAPWTPAGLQLARELNVRKLDGYLKVLKSLPASDEGIRAVVATKLARSRLAHAPSMAEVRLLESDSAIPYHAALAGTTMRWSTSEHVPQHWRSLGPRTSLFGRGARGATTPGQALRNFLGGLAAAEIAVGCRAIGLDPGMGIGLHHDIKGRESLVWEVMEAVRPTLDLLALEIISSRTWRRGDFHELPSGEVRLRPDWPVLRPETTSRARSLVAEVTRRLQLALRRDLVVGHAVELVGALVARYAIETPDSLKITQVDAPTLLTGAHRKHARQRERALN
jgi:CRISPR-associated protein Cas1